MLKIILNQIKELPQAARKITSFLPGPVRKITDMAIDLSEIILLKFIPPEVEPPPAFD